MTSADSLYNIAKNLIVNTEAAAQLAEHRAYMCEASKRSRQKMIDEAEAGDPEAVARYERYLQMRREDYHRKKEMEASA